MSFVRGRRLGLDVGTVRIGVAVCDPDGILATPYEVVYRKGGDNVALRRLLEIIADVEPVEIVIGDPTSLDGQARMAALKAAKFTAKLQTRTDIPFVSIDERFTTTQAHALLAQAGKNSRQRRETVDAAAAVLILQTWLDRAQRTAVQTSNSMPSDPNYPPQGAA